MIAKLRQKTDIARVVRLEYYIFYGIEPVQNGIRLHFMKILVLIKYGGNLCQDIRFVILWRI